jgi:hypothetical protein
MANLEPVEFRHCRRNRGTILARETVEKRCCTSTEGSRGGSLHEHELELERSTTVAGPNDVGASGTLVIYIPPSRAARRVHHLNLYTPARRPAKGQLTAGGFSQQ